MSKSPIVEIIYNIINGIRPESVSPGEFVKSLDPSNSNNLKVKPFSVFSYRDDFSYLWGFDKNKTFCGLDNFWHKEKEYKEGKSTGSLLVSNIAKDKLVTIIVWDGFPQSRNSGDMRIENWVTPIDWCVCAALNGFKYAANTSKSRKIDISEYLPDWRVFIVDLSSQHYLNSRSVSILNANPAIIPWVRLYKPTLSNKLLQWKEKFVTEDNISYAQLRAMAKDDLASLIEDLQSPERVLGLNQYQCHETLETLASIWSANIVRPGDRHEVANLVAPLILFEGIRDRENSNITKNLENEIENQTTFALTQLLINLELVALPEGGKNKQCKRLIDKIQQKLSKADNPIQILLFDDQYKLGYDDILRHIIGDKSRLECNATLDKLLEQLEKKLNLLVPITTPGWRGPLYDVPTIILLDLRLWTNENEMGNFYETIKAVMKMYIDNIKEDILKNDNQRMELKNNWIEVNKQITVNPKEENLLALTILPMLLSIIDPFQPIIIFSSSAQRETLQAFKSYPNIITSFKKPMPSGYGSNIDPIDYIEALISALEKSLDLIRLKNIGNALSQYEYTVFVDKKRVICTGFLDQANGCFDSEAVCNDLRSASKVLLRGNHRFAWALPFQLIEYWFFKLTTNQFLERDKSSPYPYKYIKSDVFKYITKIRNDFSHADRGYFCIETNEKDIDTAIGVWQKLFTLLSFRI